MSTADLRIIQTPHGRFQVIALNERGQAWIVKEIIDKDKSTTLGIGQLEAFKSFLDKQGSVSYELSRTITKKE